MIKNFVFSWDRQLTVERAGAYGPSAPPAPQPLVPFTLRHFLIHLFYLFTSLFVSSSAALSIHTSTDPLICVLTRSSREQKESTMTALIRETCDKQRTAAPNDCVPGSPRP